MSYQILGNIVIILHILLLFVYDQHINKNTNKVKRWLYNKMVNYYLYFGVWHGWAVFTSPITYNYDIYAEYADDVGEIDVVKIYDGNKVLFLDQYNSEYHIKYIENLLWDSNTLFKSSFMYFLKKNYEKSTGKKVKKISLKTKRVYVEKFDKTNDEKFEEKLEFYREY